jgi:tRNA threonylcarbamoyladenosine biosynthesis protein TsaB
MKKNINKIIALDTVSTRMSIALWEKGEIIDKKESFELRKHSEQLFIDFSEILQKNSWNNAPDLIAVDIGPGSFTGIRVGVSAARALAQGWDIPLIGVKSLDVLAHAAGPFNGIICPLIDALRNEIYYAQYSYETHCKRITDYSLNAIDTLFTVCSQKKEPLLFIGSGALLYREKIKKICGNQAVLDSENLHMPSAAHVALCALEMYPLMEDISYTGVEPFYMRSPSVEEMYQKIT